MEQALIVILLILLAGGGGALAAWLRFRPTGAPTVDIRRAIVIFGPEQNDVVCVMQRRALKPLLLRIRSLRISVIEVYGNAEPRKNGDLMDKADNLALRRALRARGGFHLFCLDDDGDIILHGQRAVSHAVLAELIAAEAPAALPAPSAPKRENDPDPTVWSVGVLR
jgi:hypothetical protein